MQKPPPLPAMARIRADWPARLLQCPRVGLSTRADTQYLDAVWSWLLDLEHGRLAMAQARADLAALVRDVRCRGTSRARPGQEQLRARAASALAELGEERVKLDGVRLVLVPARLAPDGEGGHVVTASSYVRASLDPLATVRSNVVDIATRRKVS